MDWSVFGGLQSYILSTTTETQMLDVVKTQEEKLQSYILSTTTETEEFYINKDIIEASIVHPFNNN